MTVKLPATIGAATSTLAGLDVLVTVREWERAAIVAAFTRSGGQGSYQQKGRTNLLTVGEFAALGIQGLRDRHTVAKYRNAWLSTGREAAPGGTVDLDGLGPFPPTGNNLHSEATATQRAKVVADLLADPEVATEAAPAIKDAIKAVPTVNSAAFTALEEQHDERIASRPVKAEATSETVRDEYAYALEMATNLRRAHRYLAEVVGLAQNLRGAAASDLRGALTSEIDWIRMACDAIHESVVKGETMDDQLRELLESETGR